MANWAEGLQALGAGLQGQLPQYMAGKARAEEAQALRDEQRRKQLLTLNRSALVDLASGRRGQAEATIQQALDLVPESNRQQVLGVLQRIQRGDQQGALAELQYLDDRAVQVGAIDAMPGPEYSNFRVGEDGKIYGLNSMSGTFEEMGAPEGVKFKGGGPTINVNPNPGGASTDKFGDELAKLQVEEFGSIREQANSAMEQNQLLDRLGQIDITTGFGERQKAGFAKAVNGIFGDGAGDFIMDQPGITRVEAFRALADDMVNSKLNTATGPQTDQDAQRIRDTMMSIDKEGAANDFMLRAMQATNARKIERARFMEDYLKTNRNLDGANRAWMEYKLSTPMISDSVMDRETGLPMFYSEFERKAKQRNRKATREEILQAWRELTSGS